METPIIRYNLKDRGRRYRGIPRNFNVRALYDHINGGAVQERVKHRDMLGYYGHWPRQRLGLDPREGGIIDGKPVHVEPAFVTTFLKCSMDGTVEHRAEFFDNAPGRAAAGLMNSKAGGFSSAIDENAPRFYGFDYVLEPNFTHNRPYALALDAAASEDACPLTMDEVNDYQQSISEIAQILDMTALLDSVNAANAKLSGDNASLAKRIAALELQREELLAELTRRPAARAALDSASLPVRRGALADLFERAESMSHVSAAPVQHPAAPGAEARRERKSSLLSLMGFGR